MSNWYTEPEAAVFLKVPEKALKHARYRKKVKARKICGTVQYKEEWLEEFREGSCEEHQSSASVKTRPSGTSRSLLADGLSDSARVKLIVDKLRNSSLDSSSNGKRHN